jgi:hypothetical protein
MPAIGHDSDFGESLASGPDDEPWVGSGGLVRRPGSFDGLIQRPMAENPGFPRSQLINLAWMTHWTIPSEHVMGPMFRGDGRVGWVTSTSGVGRGSRAHHATGASRVVPPHWAISFGGEDLSPSLPSRFRDDALGSM